MTAPEPRPPDQAMMRYVAAHLPGAARETATRDRVAERYGRFYAAIAVSCIVLAFFPIFDDVVVDPDDGTIHRTYGTLFEMAGRNGGDPAMIGLMLLVLLVTLLVVATFRARSIGLLVALAVVAMLIALMLVTKPGTGTPTPDLNEAGHADLALAICTVIVALAHAIHIAVIKEDRPEQMIDGQQGQPTG